MGRESETDRRKTTGDPSRRISLIEDTRYSIFSSKEKPRRSRILTLRLTRLGSDGHLVLPHSVVQFLSPPRSKRTRNRNPLKTERLSGKDGEGEGPLSFEVLRGVFGEVQNGWSSRVSRVHLLSGLQDPTCFTLRRRQGCRERRRVSGLKGTYSPDPCSYPLSSPVGPVTHPTLSVVCRVLSSVVPGRVPEVPWYLPEGMLDPSK